MPHRAGKTAKPLRALTPLAKDPCLHPGLQTGWLTPAWDPNSRVSVLSGLRGTCTPVHTQTHCIIKRKKGKKTHPRDHCKQGCEEGQPLFRWECKPVQLLGKSKRRFLKNCKMEPHPPAIPLLGIFLKASKPTYPRGASHWCVWNTVPND